ncbi:ROK family protein [bacterium C-53]|nr:ROK family protein [Lachnospiraceae bacterium]NBI04121.1 ROK family protein [Lachnospiraceae bacterium]RKJ08693.1 ROK family protein [bacterium C-53]
MDKKKITNIEVKKTNRNGVFRYICKHGTVSNPDISYNMKISLPTATQITKELIAQGLLEEKGELQSTGGRRAKALSAVANAKLAVGLDITQNHITLVLTNIVGEILKYERIHQPFVPDAVYYQKVSERLETFLDEGGADRDTVLGMGISFPGIIDPDKELITDSHALAVESVPFDSVSAFFSYPCFFLNDANAGAYAEGFHDEEAESFFYLSLSNTVGGAIFSRNELIQGKNFRCGEVGHMTVVMDGESCYCGKRGCLDAYCAAWHLSEAADGKLEQFFRLLDRGEAEAAKIWDSYTDYLAIAVNNIHMVLDCDIVLGGYVGSCMGAHLQELWDKVAKRNTFGEKEPYVKSCNYKVAAAALGAALKVIETFVSQI